MEERLKLRGFFVDGKSLSPPPCALGTHARTFASSTIATDNFEMERLAGGKFGHGYGERIAWVESMDAMCGGELLVKRQPLINRNRKR